MATPSSRSELADYCKRQLGAPVLEINIADEQVEDIMDDAIQFFQERHFDGVSQSFLKYKISQDDIDRGKGPGSTGVVGLTTTSATADIAGTEVQFDYTENSNYLAIPPEVIGCTKVFHFDGSNTITNNMFSVKYQLFLNDIYYWGATELLTYAMTKTYLEDNAQFHYNDEGDLHTIQLHDQTFRIQQYLEEQHDLDVTREEVDDVSFMGKDVEGHTTLYGTLQGGDPSDGYTRIAYDEEGNVHKRWTPNLAFISNDEHQQISKLHQ